MSLPKIPAPEPKPRRTPLLILMLNLILICNIVSLTIVPTLAQQFSETSSNAWILKGYGMAYLLNIIFMIAIIRWKRWGLWGYWSLSLVLSLVHLCYFSQTLLAVFQNILSLPLILSCTLFLGKSPAFWAMD